MTLFILLQEVLCPPLRQSKLRSNRLASLAGIERLLSLENLDVQDNQLSDPTEAARLTGIPNLRRICIKHNRFTRKYPNYRVTIFNLFRSTPGYTDDIVIDDYSPSYSERKLLIDRVPEVERHSVIEQKEEPPPEISSPVALHQASRHAVTSLAQAETPQHPLPRPEPRNAQSELAVASARRKRGPRKRIVDLSRPEESTPSHVNGPSAVEVNTETSRTSETGEIPSLSAVELVSTKQAPNDVDLERRLYATPLQPLTISSLDYVNHNQDYRQKVEALKQEFGSNWISVLSEQGWDATRDLPKDENNSFLPPMPVIHSVNSQAIASTGRTLG